MQEENIMGEKGEIAMNSGLGMTQIVSWGFVDLSKVDSPGICGSNLSKLYVQNENIIDLAEKYDVMIVKGFKDETLVVLDVKGYRFRQR